MGAALLILVAAVSVSESARAPVLKFRGEVLIEHPELRLGDLTDVMILPLAVRNSARSLVLARLTNGRRNSTISDLQLVSRLRAIMPALRPWLPMPTGRLIEVRRRVNQHAEIANQSCARSKRAIGAGADLAALDFEKSECSGTASVAVRYDSTRSVSRAGRQIAAGELIHSWPGLDGGQILPGQKLLIESGSGKVRIEHAVQAVQSAWPGQQLFVRSSDGQLHSIRYKDAR